jgi:phage host-nuclease inhibitor protein Gam
MKKYIYPAITTRDEAEAAVNGLLNITINLRHETNLRDDIIASTNESFDAKISAYEADIKSKTKALAAWAEQNPDEFPKDRKSIAFSSGTIGFRTGTPALALLNRKWSWEKVLQAVQERIPEFVRQKPEVDKEAILAQRAILCRVLPEVGVKVVQGETFYVEPTLTKVPTRQTVEAL